MKILVEQNKGWLPKDCPNCVMYPVCAHVAPASCPLMGAVEAKEVTEGRLFVDYTTHQQLTIYGVPIGKEEIQNDSNR